MYVGPSRGSEDPSRSAYRPTFGPDDDVVRWCQGIGSG